MPATPPSCPATLAAAGAPDWAQVLKRPIELSPRQTRSLAATVAVLHLAGGWALLQVPAVRAAVLEAAPMMVDLLAAPAPAAPPTPPPPAQRPRLRPPVVAPTPVLAAPSPAPLPPEAFTAPSPVPAPAPVVVAAALASPTPPTAPAPASPLPTRRRLSADAVGYLVTPPAEVPLASRRAGESGVVWLRVLVDERGLPGQVQVQRSSGFPRLDAQAVSAMRQARFRPHTEDGVAVEVEVMAPIEYPLE